MLSNILSKYKHSIFPRKINFKVLEGYRMKKKIEINSLGVHITKLSQNSTSYTFRMEMLESTKWKSELADCYALIIMYQGECKEYYSDRILKKKDHLLVKPGKSIQIESISERSVFYVEFKKVVD